MHAAVFNKKPKADFSSATEIKSEDDLIPPGGKPGTVPTDYLQATGLERLELIGKMQGIDIFDMRPLDASRKGMLAYEIEDLCPRVQIPGRAMSF